MLPSIRQQARLSVYLHGKRPSNQSIWCARKLSTLPHLRPRPSTLVNRPFFPSNNVRHASGSPSSLSTSSYPPPLPAPNTSTEAGLSTETWAEALDKLSKEAEPTFSKIPHVGYLRELGLDFGWGPTSFYQWILEHVQVYADLPWLGSIIASSIAIRVVLFPLFLQAADTSGRIAVITPLATPLRARMTAARAAGDRQAMTQIAGELRALYRDNDIQIWKPFLPMLVQTVIAFGTIRLIRNMTDQAIPGLNEGGLLWFSDLTVADPYFILPAFTSLVVYLSVKKGGETGAGDMQQRTLMLFMSKIFPVLGFAITSFMSAALQAHFAVSAVIGLTQTYLLRSPEVRRFFGIQPLPTNPTSNGAGSSSNSKITLLGRDNRPVADTDDKSSESVLGSLKAFVRDAKDKAKQQLDSQSQTKPRLSRAERKAAEDYEKRRRTEIEAERRRTR